MKWLAISCKLKAMSRKSQVARLAISKQLQVTSILAAVTSLIATCNLRLASKSFLLIACYFQLTTSSAQDIHFTQFFTQPILLAPSATGNFQGNIRGGVNYKYQWPWATNQQTFNYHSQNAFVDFALLEQKVKRGWLGIGLNFLNDAAGDGRLRYMRFGGSVAWHQAFDRENRYVLSAGFQANYITKTVDFEKFYFNNQWVDDAGFDRSLPTLESPNTNTINGFDMGFGLGFDARINDKVRLGTSFSMLHINRPQDQFYGTSNNKLGHRYIASVNASGTLNRKISYQTDAYFTFQKKAWELVLGGMVGIKTNDPMRPESNSTFWIGSYFRVKDAWSPIVGYSYKQCRLLINYDVLYSKLYQVGRLNGGLEISLVLSTGWKGRKQEQKWACPVF
jgi:type IX secretion system PorP/SprF family membrane protein